MVKILEIQTSEFLDLRKLKEDKKGEYPIGKDSYKEEVYMCDCDTFGGGDPPCDCNR